MYGDFIVTEGTYNFIYGGVIQKDFKVIPGGTLVWEGDPLQAEINIEALHENINANPSILLDNPIKLKKFKVLESVKNILIELFSIKIFT